MTKSWGMILLALWLAIYAVLALTNIQIVWIHPLHGVIAAACAICLMIGK